MSHSVAAPAFLTFAILVLVLRGRLEALNGSTVRIIGTVSVVAVAEFGIYVCKIFIRSCHQLLTSGCLEVIFYRRLQTLVPPSG